MRSGLILLAATRSRRRGARRRRSACCAARRRPSATSSCRIAIAVGSLRLIAMLRLPRLHAHRDVRAHPVAVVQRVDLDDRGAEVGEHLGAERPGDRQAEVEHPDAVERRLTAAAVCVTGATAGETGRSLAPRPAPHRCARPAAPGVPAALSPHPRARTHGRPGAACPCRGRRPRRRSRRRAAADRPAPPRVSGRSCSATSASAAMRTHWSDGNLRNASASNG